MKNILIINGPNLNMLGVREPSIYGVMSLEEMYEQITVEVDDLAVELDFVQSNHEGDIIDEIQAAMYDGVDGIVINAGAYTHYSYAIRDAIASVSIPCVEVHLSDIQKREEFRKISVIKEVCVAQISGKGYMSYVEGIRLLDKTAEGVNDD